MRLTNTTEEGAKTTFISAPVDMTTQFCDVVSSCPGVFLSVPDEAYAVVGTTLDHHAVASISTRVSPVETAVRLPRTLLEDAVIHSVLKEQRRRFIAALMIQCFVALIPFIGRRQKFASKAGRHLTRSTAPAGVSN
jgi:hypothetical protein